MQARIGGKGLSAGADLLGRTGDVRPAVAGNEEGGRPAARTNGLGDEAPEAFASPLRKPEEGVAQEKRQDLAPRCAESVEITGEIAGEIEPSGQVETAALPAEEEIEERSRRTGENEIGGIVSKPEGGPFRVPGDHESSAAGEQSFKSEAAAAERGGESTELGILLSEPGEEGGEATPARAVRRLGHHGRTPRWTATSPEWRSNQRTWAKPAARIMPASVS